MVELEETSNEYPKAQQPGPMYSGVSADVVEKVVLASRAPFLSKEQDNTNNEKDDGGSHRNNESSRNLGDGEDSDGKASSPTASGGNPSSQLNRTQTEQQILPQEVKCLEFVNDTMRRLRIGSTARLLRRGRQYGALRKHPRALRTYESTHLDGAWILGDVGSTMSRLPYAARLHHLGVLGGLGIRKQSLAFHGTEAHVDRDGEPSPHVSNMHIDIPGVTGVVVFSPPHNPAAVRKGFRDPLMGNIQLPLPYMPLAVPVGSLAEAQERWGQTEATGAKFQVPGSEVVIDVWKAKPARPSLLLGTNEPSRLAFDFLYKAIERSQYAQACQIALDFAPCHSISGNACMWMPGGHQAEDLELQWDLVTEIYKYGALAEIVIEHLGATDKETKRASGFHPHRLHNFFMIFNPGKSFGYCLPARILSTDFWTGEQFVYMPAEKVAGCRFTTAGPDWFNDLLNHIIAPNMQSTRPQLVLPNDVDPEDYALTEELTHRIEAPLTEAELSSYPWWRIERWNQRAAAKGFGVYIPLDHECKFANAVWVPHNWSVDEKAHYHVARQLPLCFHQRDVEPITPLLLFRVISGRTTDGFSTMVSGRDLLDEGFPCLYHVDCGSHQMKNVQGSGLMFPSEYIDRELLKKRHPELIDENISSGPGHSREADKPSRSGGPADVIVKLDRYLRAPGWGFYVSEGQGFCVAIRKFFKAHLAEEEKLLTWYASGGVKLAVENDYLVYPSDLWQKIADEWIPGGSIKIPAREVKLPEGDDVDVGGSKNLSAARGGDGQSGGVDEDKGNVQDDGTVEVGDQKVRKVEAWWK